MNPLAAAIRACWHVCDAEDAAYYKENCTHYATHEVWFMRQLHSTSSVYRGYSPAFDSSTGRYCLSCAEAYAVTLREMNPDRTIEVVERPGIRDVLPYLKDIT